MPRYSDEFRADAVLIAKAAGYPKVKGALSRAAREVGVSHQILGHWVRASQNPPPQKLLQRKKADILAMIKSEIRAALGEMDLARPDATYRELGTVFGILTDKMQLLSGEPTDIINWRAAFDNDSEAVEEFQDMVKELKEQAASVQRSG